MCGRISERVAAPFHGIIGALFKNGSIFSKSTVIMLSYYFHSEYAFYDNLSDRPEKLDQRVRISASQKR